MTSEQPALHAICPYFAMFPAQFVRTQVQHYSTRADWVFDPFCGRGTTVIESLLLGRNAAGSDINQVAFCVSRAKADRPTLRETIARIDYLEKTYRRDTGRRWEDESAELPPFFRRAFYPTTLRELLFLRSVLDWTANRTDCFVAALALGSMHGEMDRSSAYFSNQMARTICFKPAYSLRYWHDHRLFPKKRRVFDLLRNKAEYRLGNFPKCGSGIVRRADVRDVHRQFPELRGKVALVITSPPYFNVTRYREDQWLRLWFLGGEPAPVYSGISKDDSHTKAHDYWRFLDESWQGIAPLLKRSGKIVVRLGSIGFDQSEMSHRLKVSIKEAFPHARLLRRPARSDIARRQTLRFLPRSKGCVFEIDYTFAV